MSTTTGRPVGDADHVRLERLALEVNWRVDIGAAETLTELFTEDGTLNTLGEPVAGHDALRAWGRAMDTDSPIAGVRHVLTNLRFTADGPDRAVGTLYVTAYLPGAPDGRAATLPFAIGQCTDHYVRTPDGWRIESRVFEPFFLRDNAG
jgi:hypothetical protein